MRGDKEEREGREDTTVKGRVENEGMKGNKGKRRASKR